MASRAWRGWAAMGAIALALGAAPGCTPGFAEVLVVGRDADGTPVVGAVDCGLDGRTPAEVLTVSDPSGSGPGPVIWSAERPGAGRRAPETGPPPPPEPTDRFIGRVEMVAVGDPSPPGGDVRVALAGPLPDEVRVEAAVFVDDVEPFARIALRTAGPEDRYTVVSTDGILAEDVASAAASAAVEDECEGSDLGFDGGAFALILGLGAGAVLLAAVPVGLVTARQFRRAGAATEARRRSGSPPTP